MTPDLRPVSIAVVGCGRIGARHAEHARQFGRLVAAVDVVPERARAAAGDDARAYDDVGAMLEKETDVELVSVCTPNGLHAEHAVRSLRAGRHVLVEKPMAISVHDCGAMIHEAERANRRLFVVKQNRFNPPVVAVKRALDEGRLGRILSLHVNCVWNRGPQYYERSWKGTTALDGGTLFTQFSHFVDLMYWFAGDVKAVDARATNALHQGVIEFEDTGVATFEFHNGALGSLHYSVNAHAKNMEGSLTLLCSRGTVKIGGQYLNELEYQDIEGFRIEGLPPGNPPNRYGQYQGSMSNHAQVYENVIDVLRRQGVIATNGFEGLKTVEIIDRVYRAAGARR